MSRSSTTPTQVPLAFLDAAAVEEIPLVLWQEVLAISRVVVPGGGELSSHAEILDALQTASASAELLEALQSINELGTEGGREAIVEALTDAQIDLQGIPDCGEREFSLRIYLRQRLDPALAEAFDRAQVRLQEGEKRRAYHDFFGRSALAVMDLPRAKARLAELFLAHCREQGLGEHVQVRAYRRDELLVFQVLHTYRTRNPLAVLHGEDGRRQIRYRPVHGDIVRYDPRTGRLRVAARAPSLVAPYRRIMGAVLFEDPAFFSADEVCNLRVLQEKRRTALRCDRVRGVFFVRLVECLWARGDSLVTIRAHDCFEEVERLQLPFEEGQLMAAKLKVSVAGKSTRPVSVTIQVPSKVEVSNKKHEQLIDELLEAMGVRVGPAREAESLWTLAPWRQRRARWIAAIGALQVDEWVARGLLEPVRLGGVAHPDAPGAGPLLRVEEMDGAQTFGTSLEPSLPSRSLSATDVEGLALDPRRLTELLAARLRLTGRTSVGSAEATHALLGDLAVGERWFQVVVLLRQPRPTTSLEIRSLRKSAEQVVVVPPGAGELPGLATIEQNVLAPGFDRGTLALAIARHHNLEDTLRATETAPAGTELVVDLVEEEVWVYGERIPLTAGAHPYKFIAALARARGAGVCALTLSQQLSPAGRDGTLPARKAKRAAKQAIVEALALRGKRLNADHADPFPSAGRQMYRSALSCHVREPALAPVHDAQGE